MQKSSRIAEISTEVTSVTFYVHPVRVDMVRVPKISLKNKLFLSKLHFLSIHY